MNSQESLLSLVKAAMKQQNVPEEDYNNTIKIINNLNDSNQPDLLKLLQPKSRELLLNQIYAFKQLSYDKPVELVDLNHSNRVDKKPSLFDPVTVLMEKESRIQAKITNRIQTLGNLQSNLSNAPFQDSTIKLKTLIEYKALKLLETQRNLKAALYSNYAPHIYNHSSDSHSPNCLLSLHELNSYRRVRKHTLREPRATEAIEASQKNEREKREKQKLLNYLNSITQTGRQELLNIQKQNYSRLSKLGANVLKFHAFAEKEEQKRASKVSQERLKALKENDEDAYVKLLDEAKDTRIMAILSRTNAYLSNLTDAVVTQKDHISSSVETVEADDDKKDYYTVAHKIKESISQQSTLLVGGTLKEYQIKGLEWMISLYNNRLNGILADEMGLGKTIQTLSLITYLIEKKKQMGPFLIIIPLATMSNWVHEFDKWAPAVTKIVFKGGPQERKRLTSEIKAGNFNALITTYEYIIREKAVLSKIKWVYMIIDEGHRMKNANSKLSITLMQYYHTRYRLILTGTPLQNNLQELWSMLNFILPKIFNSVKTFDEWFSSPFTGGAAASANLELNEEEKLLMIKGLHKVLRPFLLRRLKKDVEGQLPDKVETVIKCPMSALQKKITERVRVLRNIGPFDQTKMSGSRALNNLVMQFRKICNHPFVFPEVEQLINGENNNITDIIYRAAGKFELLDRILPKFFRTGHRILMFFQMTEIMNIMEDLFRHRGWSYLRLDGSVRGEDREVLLKEFNAPNSPYDIFILSTRAGGLGLNLQTADTVILFDSDWNPHQDLQAQDRAHRIGQTKEVRILRLVTSNSIEEHILAKAQQKLDLDGKVIQAGKFDQKTSEKEREELLRVLFEAERDEKGEEDDAEEMTDEQLNEVLARSPEEMEIFAQIDKEREQRENILYRGNPPPRLLIESELPEVYRIDYSTLKVEEADDLLSIKPRERKNVQYGDVLSEEQWLEAVDSGTLEQAIQQKQEMIAKRPHKREAGDMLSDNDDDDDEVLPEDFEDDELKVSKKSRKFEEKSSANSSASKFRKGRKSKAAMIAEDSLQPDQRAALNAILNGCLQAIRACTTESETGEVRNRSDIFEILPSKRHYKDYYVTIKRPIALEVMIKKINNNVYTLSHEFRDDMKLMFENARTYNAEGSEVYEDANALEEIFDAKYEELVSGKKAEQEYGIFEKKVLPKFKLRVDEN